MAKLEAIREYSFSSKFNKSTNSVGNESTNMLCYQIYNAFDNTIVLYSTYRAAPRVAYFKHDKYFLFTTTDSGIDEFYNDIGISCPMFTEGDLLQPEALFKKSVRNDFLYKDAKFITNWQKIIIRADGSFDVIPSKIIPYSVDLVDAYDLLYAWTMKYKKIVDDLVNISAFYPTITGGLDTRILSAFYRSRLPDILSYTKFYYVKDEKPDGKGHTELYQFDKLTSSKIGSKFGFIGNIEHFMTNTLSGMFTENDREKFCIPFNDSDFINKFVQHRRFRTKEALMPFIDDLFIQIKSPNKKVLTAVLALIYIPDLLDIQLVSDWGTFKRYNFQPYLFRDEYKDAIIEAQKILDVFGADKVEAIRNILK